jgi:hypothetical protein
MRRFRPFPPRPRAALGLVALLAAAPAAAQTTTAAWQPSAGSYSGTWTDPLHWTTNPNYPSNGTPPGATYAAVIDAAPGSAYSVTLSSNVTVNSVTLNSNNATLSQTAGTFTGTVNMQFGAYNMSGGTLKNSTIVAPTNSNAPGRYTVVGASTFDNVTLQGTAFVDQSATLTIQNGLTLTSNTGEELWFQGSGAVNLPGNQTIGGTGGVVFAQGNTQTAVLRATGGGTLTIGSGVTVRASSRGFSTLGDPNSGLVINGQVVADSGFASVTVTGTNWVNNGTLSQYSGGGINLMGTFTTAGLGNFLSPEGRINIIGTLTNTGATLTMDAAHGYLVLKAGGTVIGGTISGTAAYPFTTNPGNVGQGTLDGVTLAGTTRVWIGTVQVLHGLTLNNATVNIDGVFSTTGATLSFPGNQTLGGTGEVVFAGPPGAAQPAGGTLTIGPGVTVRTGGADGALGAAGNGLANQGTVSAQTANKTLAVYGDAITNDGTMEARTNTTLSVNPSASLVNRGLIVAQSGGTVSVAGTLTQNTNTAAETRVIGTLTATAVAVNAGSLTGTGTVNAPVTNGARVSPGVAGPGVLTVGNYTQTAAGVLDLEVGGTTRGTQYDALVAGAISLNGTVKVSLVNGFAPSAGQSFDVLDWSGGFAGSPAFDFSAAALPAGLTWDTSQFSTDGTLRVVPVPEPGLLSPLAVVAGVWSWRRRRSPRGRHLAATLASGHDGR